MRASLDCTCRTKQNITSLKPLKTNRSLPTFPNQPAQPNPNKTSKPTSFQNAPKNLPCSKMLASRDGPPQRGSVFRAFQGRQGGRHGLLPCQASGDAAAQLFASGWEGHSVLFGSSLDFEKGFSHRAKECQRRNKPKTRHEASKQTEVIKHLLEITISDFQPSYFHSFLPPPAVRSVWRRKGYKNLYLPLYKGHVWCIFHLQFFFFLTAFLFILHPLSST